MKAIDIINDMQVELKKVKAERHVAVSVDVLLAYLAELEPVASSSAAEDEVRARERAKHELEVWKVKAQAEHTSNRRLAAGRRLRSPRA